MGSGSSTGISEEVGPQDTPLPTIGTSPLYSDPTYGDSASELNPYNVDENIQLIDFDVLNASFNEDVSNYNRSLNVSIHNQNVSTFGAVNTESITHQESNMVTGIFGSLVSYKDINASSPAPSNTSNHDQMLSPPGAPDPNVEIDQQSFSSTNLGDNTIALGTDDGNLLSLVNFAIKENIEFEMLDDSVTYKMSNSHGLKTNGEVNDIVENSPQVNGDQPKPKLNQSSTFNLNTLDLESIDLWDFIDKDEPPAKRQKCC